MLPEPEGSGQRHAVLSAERAESGMHFNWNISNLSANVIHGVDFQLKSRMAYQCIDITSMVQSLRRLYASFMV